MKKSYIYALSLLLLGAISLNGQNKTDQIDRLHLKSGVFHLQDPITTFTDLSFFKGKATVIVRFDELISQNKKKELKSKGLEIPYYLDGTTYLGIIDETFEPYFGQSEISIYDLSPEMKLDEDLFNDDLPFHAISGEYYLISAIHLGQFSHETIRFDLESKGYTVLSDVSVSGLFDIQVKKEKVNELYGLPYFYFFSAVAPDPEPENYQSRTNHRINALSPSHELWKYDGEGINVAMGDNGEIGPHIDYQGRVDQQYANPSSGNHGDHVAGIIMGAGNLDPLGRGNAPGAFLYAYDPYENVYSSPAHYTLHDIRITSTSYSNGCNAGYTSFARFCDSTIRVHTSLMHVMSAGNSGGSNCGTYPTGWGNVTGGFKVGKNTLAVANLNHYDQLSSSSSRGPARDGRLKPDIAAVGTGVYSTVSGNNYDNFTGTSMSCPGISGVLASLYHAYKDLGNGTDPNSGLIKSIILNTAEDLGNPGPDFKFGYGRVNASKALKVIQDSTWFEETSTTADLDTFQITLPAGVEFARIMLYWNDYEGIENAAIPLVNDLKLVVYDPTETPYHPWILDHTPVDSILDADAVRGIDTINNAEQVTLKNPTAGTYLVVVEGISVPQGPQTYFLNYHLDMEPIQLVNPLGGEGFVPGTSEIIRWDTQNKIDDVDIEYSTDNGQTWNSIASGINAALGYYVWSVPNTISNAFQIRVHQSTYSHSNQVNFTILDQVDGLSAFFVCGDTISLSWDAVNGADEYIVRRLGAKYMDSLQTTTNNYAVLTGHDNTQTQWYAVEAVLAGNSGRRSLALEVGPGEFNCDEDLAIEIVDPSGNVLYDCSQSYTYPLTIKLSSLGPYEFTGIKVSFISSTIIYTDSITDTLKAGTSMLYTFQDSIIAYGITLLGTQAWHNQMDNAIANDSDWVFVEIKDSLYTFPISEDFDLYANCSTFNNCELTTCPLPGDWYNEINGEGDDIDWRVNSGTTPSNTTGPSGDNTSGSGKYVYLEASNGCTSHTAILRSPCIDLSTATWPFLSFYHHMYGADMGSLFVDVFHNGIWIEGVYSINGDQGDQWNLAEVDLSNYIGEIIQIRFRGITGSDWASDISLDDISLYNISSAPLVDFTSDQSINCLVSEVQFIDQSTLAPNAWSWEITPNTYQFVGGTNANSQNPIVLFNDTGYYDVKLVATNSIGSDSLTQSQFLYVGTGLALPINEGFDAMSLCGTDMNCMTEICPLDNGWENLSNGEEDDIDWRVNTGSTPSIGTGPSSDVSGTGNYLYLEASGGCNGLEALLVSPCIDLSVQTGYSPKLYFSYHMSGADMGDLHVDILSDGILTEDIIPAKIGDQGLNWVFDTVDLSAYVNTTVKIRFRGITGADFASDISLDNIGITNGEPIAAPDFTVMVNEPCINETFIFSDNSVGNVNSYAWEFGTGAIPSTASGIGPHSVQYISAGNKLVKLTLTNGGGTSSSSQNLQVLSGPNSTFTYSIPSVGTYDFTMIDAASADSVKWDFGDGATSTLLNPSHSYMANSNYQVELTAYGTCGHTITAQGIIVSGIGVEEWLLDHGFNMYPNPARDNLFISFDQCPSDEIGIRLKDISGREIRADQFSCSSDPISIDISDLSSGSYLIEIHAGSKQSTKKFIVQ